MILPLHQAVIMAIKRITSQKQVAVLDKFNPALTLRAAKK
jgi:hypothetical protein